MRVQAQHTTHRSPEFSKSVLQATTAIIGWTTPRHLYSVQRILHGFMIILIMQLCGRVQYIDRHLNDVLYINRWSQHKPHLHRIVSLSAPVIFLWRKQKMKLERRMITKLLSTYSSRLRSKTFRRYSKFPGTLPRYIYIYIITPFIDCDSYKSRIETLKHFTQYE
jgi:hypothetical protein